MKRMHLAALAALLVPALRAQYAPAPDAYTLTEINAMLGPSVNVKIYRDGQRAVIDSAANNVRAISLFDFQAHSSLTWAPDGKAECGKSRFSGDWGDPFAFSAEMLKDAAAQHPRQLGTENVAGIAAKVIEASTPDGATAKAWIEPKYGLLLKAVMTPKGKPAQTIVEVRSFTVGRPPASIFTPPAGCADAARQPLPQSTEERIAAETGGNASDYTQAIMPPPSSNACSVRLRVVRAGTMEPITSGFQIAIDSAVDPQHGASYTNSQGPGGRVTFSGGAMREQTANLRNGVLSMPVAPRQFQVDVEFGAAGSSSALIYRQCYHPRAILLLVVKNPRKLSDGADWLWVKSGPLATPEP